MKDFHRSFICRSTDTGKKGHRSKHHSNKNEVCKCYAPFLKLHYYDCPVAKRPCPVHGNPYRPCVKDEKAEKKENMIISFHPSFKTDRLFKPVKNLLAHCSSETKINVEYYSPNNSNFKNNIKHCQVQTSPQELKKNLGYNVFVEKTKSIVTDKTNRMKRLKQCFYSPCNSIVARTRSQITLKDKINENFQKNAKDIAVATNIPEELPENVYFDEKFKWSSSNKLDSSDWEKSSNDKMESDFVTVTKQVQDKIIDHKIFEIKHKKGLGDFRYTKPPKEAPLVYSTYDIGKSKSTFNVENGPLFEQKNLEKYSKNNELVGKIKKEEETNSSGKSQSSSSGSVYFTPFILIPPGVDESSSEGSKYSDYMGKMNKGKARGKVVDAQAQTENPPEKVIYEASSTSENSSSKSSEFYKETTPLKEKKNLDAEDKSPSIEYVLIPEESPRGTTKTSGKKNSDALKNSLGNTNKFLDESTQITPPNSRLTNEYELFGDKTDDTKTKPIPEDFFSVEKKQQGFDDKKYNSMQIQTDAVQKKEVALVYDGIKNVTNRITQTDPVLTKNVQVETMAPKKNKSQMTYSTTARSVQTSFTLSDSTSQSNEEDFKDLDGNVSFVVTSCITPDARQDINKSRWKKSHSDGDLYNGPTDNSASDNVIPLRHICLCENSETSTSESELNACEKNCKSDKSISEKSNMKPIQYQNEQRPTALKKDVISKGEQTSLSDLTELLKMVDQLFDKMSKETFKSCDCEKIKQRESKISPEINTDFSKSVKKPKTIDVEVQTMYKMTTDVSEEEKAKESLSQGTRRNAGAQSTGETVFICKICRKKVSTLVAETCTTLDSVEKSSSSKKEVTFTSLGTSTDGLEKPVLCKSIGVCVSDNVINYCVPAQRQSVDEIKRNFTCDSNDQSPNEWTINTTSKKCCTCFESSSPKEESKFGSNKSQVKKESTTTSQVSEKKFIKKTQGLEAWKSPEYSLLSESHSISRTSDFCKPRAAPGREKSNIPTASNNLRKPINLKAKETGKTNMNTQVPIMQSVNKEVLRSERDPCATVLSINRNTVCFCDSPKPSSKIEPSTSGNSRCTDQKPPLPMKQQPGVSNTKAKTSPSQIPSPTSKKPGQKKTMVYPAIIRPILYTDFRKAWQIMKNFQSHDSNSKILKKKRYCEKEYHSPGGKKIKRKENGSGENSKFENNIFTAHGQKTIDNNSGFVWTPSSTQEISKTESHPKCFYRGSQSESKVSNIVSQNLPLFKGFNKGPANAMSVTSCRLKPVQVNEKHPFKKLFECRLCKSLNFLKNDQKDILQNEKPSDGAFGFESLNAKDESQIFDDENSEPFSWVFPPEIKDNFLLEYSFSSDLSDSTNLSKKSDLFSDGRKAKSESVRPNFFNHSSARAGSVSNMADPSRSFQTFWFGSERKK